MLDVITLQARGQHKQEQYRQEAAHECLLQQLRRERVHPAGSGAPQAARRWLLLGASALLLVAVAARPSAAPVAAAPAAALVDGSSVPMLATPVGRACWVSGDLVGDANPATIAAALCDR
jgi:hypothetical protein